MRIFIYIFVSFLFSCAGMAQVHWDFLSTSNGKIPLSWTSTQQTSALVVDFNNDGVNDIVLGFRQKAPALIGLTKTATGWKRYLIDSSYLTIEAGGAAYDIDGDGDMDIVFGGDWQSNEVWWWENPYPNLSPDIPWKRHMIKNTGATQHHDQAFGDFMRTGKPQLAFWNQGSKTLYIAEIPADPKDTAAWKLHVVYQGKAGDDNAPYAEGVIACDINGDGYTDLLAGNYWFEYLPVEKIFKPIRIARIGGRIAAGKFKPGKTLQVVIAPGDGSGPLTWYECIGDPEDSSSWKGHDLAGRDLIHGHALAVADINGDGNLDIFTAEMAKWSEQKKNPDNPAAQAFVFYGDGKGNFRKEIFKTGFGFHETRLADIDGDGDIDVISKPYNWKAPRLDIWLQNGTGKLLPKIHDMLKNKIAMELYSLRGELKKDVPGTLRKIKAMGVTEVEVSGFHNYSPAGFKKQLDLASLRPTSILFPYETLRDSLDKIIAICKMFGLKNIGVGWIPHKENFSYADALTAAALFNLAGAKLKANGLHFFYHAHGYEFAPYHDSTLFDLMAAKMRPGVADFQLDVFWVTRGGADPALLLKKYPHRFISMHIKDLSMGMGTGDYSGSAPDSSSVVAGKGQVNWKEVMDAAIQVRVKQFFIEDESPDALQQVPLTLEYFRHMQ
jgi:sugar phosphate isomerase/epimerase